jgi:hypothetical protein
MKYPLNELIKCAKRELALRSNVYPKWVRSGRIRQDFADKEIDMMNEIVMLLQQWEESA